MRTPHSSLCARAPGARFGRGLAPTVDPGNRNDLLHPRLAKAAPVWLEQGPGEVVFVPSGWHHEVWNLDDALSVNCNWCAHPSLITPPVMLTSEFKALPQCL